MCVFLLENVLVLENMFLVFSRSPGGFRELREAYRNHVHLSWYLQVPGITSYCQKSLRVELFKTRVRYLDEEAFHALLINELLHRDAEIA